MIILIIIAGIAVTLLITSLLRDEKKKLEAQPTVLVMSLDGTQYLGKGTIISQVTTYMAVDPQRGDVHSLELPEEYPLYQIPEDWEILRKEQDVKIILDSGKVVYGSQVRLISYLNAETLPTN